MCTLSGTKNFGRHDHEKWRTRDVDELRGYAEQWRDASTEKDREDIFKKYGVRWSELWRLPYWNPARQLTVDSMHCILEGLVSSHFRHVLKLTVASATAKTGVIQAFDHVFRQPVPEGHRDREDQPPHGQLKKNEVQHVAQIHALLTGTVGGDGNAEDNAEAIEQDLKLLAAKLAKKNKKPLVFVCDDLGLQPLGKDRTKQCYADCLVQWVRIAFLLMPVSNVLLQRKLKPTTPPKRPSPKVVSPEVIGHIRSVIRNTATPSWLDSVPQNFGEAAAGTLKAAEWRILSTIYLPLALISLWGAGSSHPSPEKAKIFRNVLDHTMWLVSAVIIVCHRSMSPSRAAAYLDYITRYVRALKEIHPDAEHQSIHHMAIHIYDFLHLFGPTRSWWAFPFERLIGHLQRLPHNHKFGRLFYCC